MPSQDEKNRILLFRAIDFGQLNEVQRLITEQGADINCLNTEMNTPLLHALKFGQCHVARWLVDNGADMHYVSANELGMSALHYAVNTGDEYLVQKCLDAGVDPNIQTKFDGSTALHRTIKFQSRFAPLLLKYGANPNIQNNRGETVLGLECIRGPLEVKLHKTLKDFDAYFILHKDETGENDIRKDIDQTASLCPNMFKYRQIEKYMSGRIEFPETESSVSLEFNNKAANTLIKRVINGRLFNRFPADFEWSDFVVPNANGVCALDVIKRRGELGLLCDQKEFWLKNQNDFPTFWRKHLKEWQRRELHEIKSTLDVEFALQKRQRAPLKRRPK